jgi:hypothetical protein
LRICRRMALRCCSSSSIPLSRDITVHRRLTQPGHALGHGRGRIEAEPCLAPLLHQVGLLEYAADGFEEVSGRHDDAAVVVDPALQQHVDAPGGRAGYALS